MFWINHDVKKIKTIHFNETSAFIKQIYIRAIFINLKLKQTAWKEYDNMRIYYRSLWPSVSESSSRHHTPLLNTNAVIVAVCECSRALTTFDTVLFGWEKISVKMESVNKRKYNYVYIKYGFISMVKDNVEHLQCVICYEVFSNDAMNNICQPNIPLLKKNQKGVLLQHIKIENTWSWIILVLPLSHLKGAMSYLLLRKRNSILYYWRHTC